ncbi:hypothetical protein D9758_011861 [Tetrapyrgos nigripes]|uniref:Cytochrome P450 n=1 Tax=Tetrapyrgos nigripes TaxID=182062 RepID=A0A8H5FNY2_9AGAR|nr:hypothetical protein D9758_011861 [Tetrapyrgos nigripes]
MTMMSSTSTSLLGFVLLSIIYYRWMATRTRARLPPGPKRLPIIGSLLDTLPARMGLVPPNPKPFYEQYLEIGKANKSDVIHIDVLGNHTVVLNSVKAATELLDRRSSNYSSRPALHMLDDLMGWDWNLSHMPYSDRWRRHRKAFTHYFQPRAITEHHPFQRKSITELLQKLLASPEPDPAELEGYIQHHAGSVILHATYGVVSPKDKEYYVDLAHRAMTSVLQAALHGTYLIDYFPLLKYVPNWFPGAGFKREAKTWSKYSIDLRDQPWDQVQSEIAAGTALPSFVTRNLEGIDTASVSEQMIEEIKNCAGIAYLAGSDSSIALMRCAILALATHPEVQERAQKELDSVLGTGGSNARLPDYTDRGDLPYLSAIISETLRYYPVTPLDDLYEGYYIPKGSTVIGNSWAILHDEQLYPDPMTYNPSRFLKTNSDSGKEIEPQPNPALYAFGFGRRICPGRWLALDTSWLVISCILATCTIKKALDSDGKEIEPLVEYERALVDHLKPYRCRFVPRSEASVKLMKNGFLSEDD